MGPGLWVRPDELPGKLSTDPDAVEACGMATSILWALSGRKYVAARTVTETYERACSRPSALTMPLRWPATPTLDAGAIRNVGSAACGCQGVSGGRHTRLRLRGTPVRRVQSVRGPSGELDPGTYRVENSGLLRLDDAAPCDVDGLTVTYTYGTGLPSGAKVAARLLAAELLRSWSGDDECRIPDRVTNVSREGMSMTIMDKQDFIDDLRTGIYEIDLFLRAANPDRARKKARVFSPDIPKAYRTTANGVPGIPAGQALAYDLYAEQGERLNVGLRRYRADGTALSLAGYSWRAEARSAPTDGAGSLVANLTDYLSLSATDDTLLVLDVPGNVTAALELGRAYWDLFYWPTNNPGASTKWLSGHFAVGASVTNMEVL